MKADFKADAHPLLIGSIPTEDHDEALGLVTQYTPRLPLWAQLPAFREEGMMLQFLPGMPGYTEKDDKFFIDMNSETLEQEILAFYESYLMVTEGGAELDDSRFVLTDETAKGFFKLLAHLEKANGVLGAKGQITGPLTFCTGVTDQDGRAIFYDDQMRDMAVKLLALKAKWQVRQFAKFNLPSIIFFDEPALAGFGSSQFISISRDDLSVAFEEVIQAVHDEDALAGIHVCANSDWSLLFDSSIDIVSFDAYAYFDNFILYGESLKKYLERGGIIAWGIVPTLNPEDVENEESETLLAKLNGQIERIEALGVERSLILAQSLITPSCGTGSLTLGQAEKVLRMTAEISASIRKA